MKGVRSEDSGFKIDPLVLDDGYPLTSHYPYWMASSLQISGGLWLTFLFEWAIPYWIDELLAVASIGIASAAGYWLLADESVKSKLTMFLLGYTIFHQWLSGAFDWLWFIVHRIYGYAFPALDAVWWWNPYYWFFGIEWTTLHHILYTIIMEAILLIIWYMWKRLYKKKSYEQVSLDYSE